MIITDWRKCLKAGENNSLPISLCYKLGIPLLLALAGAFMLWQSWGQWPDVLIDFGRELYVPWQLAQGKVLYRDLTHLFGPLSQYFNAAIFRLFGVSIISLVFANLTLLILLVCLIYWLLLQIASRLAATVACLTFIFVFAFNQYTYAGNYNYICPYAHEITHGLILSLGAIALFFLNLKSQRLYWLFFSGLGLGLSFLTKPETFLAAEIAIIFGLLLTSWRNQEKYPPLALKLSFFGLGQIIPPAIAWALLSLAMKPAAAFRGILGSWLYMFDRRITDLAFYRSFMGLTELKQNLLLLFSSALAFALLIILTTWLALCWKLAKSRQLLIGAIFLALVAVSLTLFLKYLPAMQLARPLPLIMFFAAALIANNLLRQPGNQQSIFQLVMIIFSLFLLLKIFFFSRVYNYGFVLAMPATLITICLCLAWLPQFIQKRGGTPALLQLLFMALLVIGIAGHLRLTNFMWSLKSITIKDGPDWFLADERGRSVNIILGEINRRLSPQQTLAVFPEGVMLNYLSRKNNPTPFINFMPPLLDGEENIVHALNHHPPDLIALVHKNTEEFGFKFFGQDYGKNINSWILANYHPLGQVGATPLVNEQFGILLLGRNPH